MKATLEYELPKEQEAFNAALHGPDYSQLVCGLILRLTKIAYPDDAPANKLLVSLLRELEQHMEELGLNRDIQFGEVASK
jgi:hypothetical protein